MTKRSVKTFGLTHTSIPITPEFLMSEQGAELLRPPQATDLLEGIETQALQILRDQELDESWIFSNKKPADFPNEISFHAANALKHFPRIHHWLRENNASMAVFETIHMMEAIRDIWLTTTEADTFRGHIAAKSSQAGGIAKRQAGMNTHKGWQAAANKIWKVNRPLSVSAVAKQIAHRGMGEYETIRKVIKKPK